VERAGVEPARPRVSGVRSTIDTIRASLSYLSKLTSADLATIRTMQHTSGYKNPAGGLTAAGRAHYKQTEGAHLQAGVKNYTSASPADKKRWVSWATRFAGQSSLPPLRKPNGEPTRFALMFTAWGEPVPSNPRAVRAVYQKAKTRSKQLSTAKK